MTPSILRSENRRLETVIARLEDRLREKEAEVERERDARAQAVGTLERELEITRREYELKLAEAQAKLKDLLRRLFGPSSEKIDPKQHLLALSSVEDDQALAVAEPPVPAPPPESPKPKAKRGARRPAPQHLPVERVVHDLPEDQKRDPNTGEPLSKIREEVTEEIDYRPSRFVRVQHVVPVYASPSKSTAPMQAVIERVLPGSGVGTGLLVHITVSKFQDHVPLYRLEQIAARQGVTLDRSKMSKWVEHVALLLSGLTPLLERRLFESGYVQCDETTVKVLDPERPGAARQAYLWVRHAPTAKVIIFEFDPTRRHEVALGLFPPEYKGVVQTDCYQAYDELKRQRPGVVTVHCWAHLRRKWVEAVDNGGETVAVVLALIAELYKIEKGARGLPFDRREQMRAGRSQMLLSKLRSRMEAAAVSALPSSAIGQASAYGLSRWEAFTRFAEPGFGHIEIDNNPVENGLRPTALGRRNWLFIGHPDAGWKSATIYSILGTCKLLGVNPEAYLTWVLPKLASGTNRSAADLLPHDYARLFKEPSQPAPL
jgi:transposase